jgi:hypothetical protein
VNKIQDFAVAQTVSVSPVTPRTFHNRQRIHQRTVEIKQKAFALHGGLHQALII